MNICMTNGTTPTSKLITYASLLELIGSDTKLIIVKFSFWCNFEKIGIVVNFFASTILVIRAQVGSEII